MCTPWTNIEMWKRNPGNPGLCVALIEAVCNLHSLRSEMILFIFPGFGWWALLHIKFIKYTAIQCWLGQWKGKEMAVQRTALGNLEVKMVRMPALCGQLCGHHHSVQRALKGRWKAFLIKSNLCFDTEDKLPADSQHSLSG